MKRRRTPNRAAQTAAIARKRLQPVTPTPPTPSVAPLRLSSRSAAEATVSDRCPVCGAEAQEEGLLGCCGALTATCEGAVNGIAIDWDAVDSNGESDRLADLAEYHDWYVDTRELAPSKSGAGDIRCRCEQPA